MNKTQPLISIIIPVYKTEPYLRKCLDSVAGQTYKNLEIIIVDDGSPDDCGAICDEYAVRDKRITVIHQENGGISAARNSGMDIATGAYFGFVDSDDWCEPDMYEYLMGGIEAYGADICCCDYTQHGGRANLFYHSPDTEVLSQNEALLLLLEDKLMQNHVWNKLFEARLFESISFPVGFTFEDVAVSYRLFERATRVVRLTDAKYNYLIRPGSITETIGIKDYYNRCMIDTERFRHFEPMGSRYTDLILPELCHNAIMLAYHSARHPFDLWKYNDALKNVSTIMADNRDKCVAVCGFGRLGKAQLRALTSGHTSGVFISFMLHHLERWKRARWTHS